MSHFLILSHHTRVQQMHDRSYAIRRVQQLRNLQIHSSEEPTKTVRRQNVKSFEMTVHNFRGYTGWWTTTPCGYWLRCTVRDRLIRNFFCQIYFRTQNNACHDLIYTWYYRASWSKIYSDHCALRYVSGYSSQPLDASDLAMHNNIILISSKHSMLLKMIMHHDKRYQNVFSEIEAPIHNC